jgi:hypothetical protein
MIGATLLFTHAGKGPAHDDKITIVPYNGSHDILEVTYYSPELKSGRRFLASFSTTLHYVEDMLTSMRHDAEPFENIQLLTAIHPSILYHVVDMDDSDVRDLIVNMVGDALKFEVTRVPR